MWCGFLYKTAITSVQRSQRRKCRNVTTLDWAKLAKWWQALCLSDKQTNRHHGLTYTSRSSLRSANVDVQLSKLARHQSLLWYRMWWESGALDHKVLRPYKIRQLLFLFWHQRPSAWRSYIWYILWWDKISSFLLIPHCNTLKGTHCYFKVMFPIFYIANMKVTFRQHSFIRR